MTEKRLNMTKLLAAAESKGLNQSAIAKGLGVTRASVSKWFMGKSFPRPAELMALGRILKLRHEELVERRVPEEQPLVAFRKRASCKTTDAHIARALNMGHFLKPLVCYLSVDEFLGPPSLKSPSCDYRYLQELAARIRREADIAETAPFDFKHLIQLFRKYQAVIIPTLWGHKTKHENALHIHLPESQTTWIYLNLDVEIHDFKFWMAHELGHVLTVDLLREGKTEEAEDFADAFAGALLFPGVLATKALSEYAKARTDHGRLTVLEKWAKEHTISPNSVYKEIEKQAKETKTPFTAMDGKTLFPAICAFNKSYKTLSAALFDDTVPTADHFMRVAQETFDTEVYRGLGQYVRETDAGAGVIAAILDVNPMDARAYLEALKV
jgi:transcriptional regulator with XRE-family HTH domain